MSTEPNFWPVYGADKLRIIKRFPEQWGGIIALYGDSEDFRLLCQEYGLATDALSKLSNHDDASSSRIRVEYEEIVRELESEILNYIIDTKGLVTGVTVGIATLTAKGPETGISDSLSITVSQPKNGNTDAKYTQDTELECNRNQCAEYKSHRGACHD
jgi:hypothetical protein